MMTDPVADMLTRIRNALSASHDRVEFPASKTVQKMSEYTVTTAGGRRHCVFWAEGRLLIFLHDVPCSEFLKRRAILLIQL